MIGPSLVKMPDKLTCLGCDALKLQELGGTKKFPKKWISFYCSHSDLPTQVSFIARNKPWTPIWCPATKEAKNHDRRSRKI